MRARQVVPLLLLLASGLGAQSRPESGTDTRDAGQAFRAERERIVRGEADVPSLRFVVERLLREHPLAATWWVALHDETTRGAPLTAAEKEDIARLRRSCENPEAFADEKKIVLRVIREAEARIASKDPGGARLAASVAHGFLGLVPDPALSRLLAAADMKLPPPQEAPGVIPAAPTWPGGLTAQASAVSRNLVARGLAAYREAGCRPGRYALARSLRLMAPLLPRAEALDALAKLRSAVRDVEPRAGLSVFLRTVGTARFLRDGMPLSVTQEGGPFDAEKGPLLDIPTLPGDLLTIAIDEAYSFDDVEGRSFVLALNARFEGRDLGPAELFCDIAEKPGAPGVHLYAAPIAKRKPNPPPSLFGRGKEQDEALRAFNVYFELPRTTRRSVDVPCLGDMVLFAQEFETRKLAPIWIGTEADHFAVVIAVPDR